MEILNQMGILAQNLDGNPGSERIIYYPTRNGLALNCPYAPYRMEAKTAEEIAAEQTSLTSLVDINQPRPAANPMAAYKQVPTNCSSICPLLELRQKMHDKKPVIEVKYGCCGHKTEIALAEPVAEPATQESEIVNLKPFTDAAEQPQN